MRITKACIVTGGTKCGCMELVDQYAKGIYFGARVHSLAATVQNPPTFDVHTNSLHQFWPPLLTPKAPRHSARSWRLRRRCHRPRQSRRLFTHHCQLPQVGDTLEDQEVVLIGVSPFIASGCFSAAATGALRRAAATAPLLMTGASRVYRVYSIDFKFSGHTLSKALR